VLKTRLLHPHLLSALASAGHGSRVLIADGNYPVATTLGPNAQVVYLNLSPGVIDVVTALAAVAHTVPVEQAWVMQPDSSDSGEEHLPPVWDDFRRLLLESGSNASLEPVGRHAFYELSGTRDVALVIATADQRWYANLMLGVGALQPGTGSP
jgi:L-fucose mutarotase